MVVNPFLRRNHSRSILFFKKKKVSTTFIHVYTYPLPFDISFPTFRFSFRKKKKKKSPPSSSFSSSFFLFFFFFFCASSSILFGSNDGITNFERGHDNGRSRSEVCAFDGTLYRCNQHVKVNIVWQWAECKAGVSFPRTYLARTRPVRAGKKRVRERTNITGA